MKNILLLSILFSFSTFAGITVERSDLICNFARTGETVFSSGTIDLNSDGQVTTVDVDRVLDDMQSEIQRVVVGLEISQDPLSRLEHSICIGVYDDQRGENAGAYGSDFILFGARLIKMMADSLNLSYYNAFYPIFYHELAHTIQNLRGEDYSFPLRNISVKKKELQADCLAGALMQLHERVSYHSYIEAMKLFSHLGDSNLVQDHGIKPQRQAAYAMGVFSIKQASIHLSQVDTDYLFKSCNQKKVDSLIFGVN